LHLALAVLLARTAHVADQGGPPAPSATAASRDVPEVAPTGRDDGRRTLGRFPANLARGAVGMFSRDNLVPFLVGGAATGTAAFFDDDVRDAVANPDASFGQHLQTAGSWPSAVVTVGLFTAGRFAHGPRFRAMTYDLADAAIVSFAYTGVLKVTVRRERPDGSNNLSFPSGHASNAFALATVAERHYGWKVGVPTYALAGAIAYSRVVHDKHYLSDTLAGATLGYIAGRTVVRVNDRPISAAGPRATVTLSPVVARGRKGLVLDVAF
jgi:membrane-associated phospholipid phosphatase